MVNYYIFRCAYCGALTASPVRGRGRRPRYCTGACRQAAYRSRTAVRELAQEALAADGDVFVFDFEEEDDDGKR